MLESFKNRLLKPYPFFPTIKSKLFMALGFGKFMFLFFYIFKPITIENNDNIFIKYTLGLGVISFIIMLFNIYILPLLFIGFFNINKWTIGKMYLFSIITIVMVCVADWYYNFQILTYQTFPNIIWKTFLIGLSTLVLYFYLNEKRKSKQHIIVANNLSSRINTHQKNKNPINSGITLETNSKNKSYSIKYNDVVYITTEKEHTCIFYKKKGIIKKELIQISLNNVEKQLGDLDFMVRCHKSYIINNQEVEKIKGNARGYFLQLKNSELSVPVSTNFPQELLFTLVG